MKPYVLILPLFLCLAKAQDNEFPESFLFGVGSASYQIEGAWNADGKGENIWDFVTRDNPDLVVDRSNGNVACDAYSKTGLDVQLIKNMSVNYYSFSLSWSRLFPKGYTYNVNQPGVDYYNRLIDELLENDIIPYVTLYHWDLPQPLLEIGGWPNPVLADVFEEYADKVFELFGDRVKNWITFNEPYQICEQGFGEGVVAPGYRQMGIGGYLCGHTVLRAHAKAFHLYNDKYRTSQTDRVGITVHASWAEPESETSANENAAQTWMQQNVGWFLNPIFSTAGDYPTAMKTRIATLSTNEGFPRSRLPTFTAEEIALIRGSANFLGLSHYGSLLCRPAGNNVYETPSHAKDVGTECYLSEDWDETAASWFSVTPWGMRNLLNWIRTTYNNPEVIITGNGFADSDGELRDCGRVLYHNAYLEAVLEAIHEDGCRVSGYTAWSVMDLFEWQYGYTYAFGLHQVNFGNAQRPRMPKMSSYVYRNIIETRRVDGGYAPDGFETCSACALLSSKLIFAILACLLVFSRRI